MADRNSTRVCVHCEKPFEVIRRPGPVPRYCSKKCSDAESRMRRPTNPRLSCSIEGCARQRSNRGFCATHYYRWRVHGDPLFTTRGLLISKSCEWCGQEMRLKPSIAKRQSTCSLSCSSNLKAKKAGLSHRLKTFFCQGCRKEVTRAVRPENDSGRFCSRNCAFDLLARVAAEREALRRIGERRRKAESERYRLTVLPEVRALRRIAAYVPRPCRIETECKTCGRSMTVRRTKGQRRFVCDSCKLESLRASRRAGKARRRARKLGRDHDNIDPIKVFERDGWRCHLCGNKTLKSKRGTWDDRAPELEHVISLADGGTHTWDNVACSCRKCNQEKGAETRGQLGLMLAAG